MTRIVFHRCASSLAVLFGLLTITFFLIRLAPGDPSVLYEDASMDAAESEKIREYLGLKDPLFIQYGKWLGIIPPFRGVLEGNWGISFTHHRPVFDVILSALPHTLWLTLSALGLDLLLGISFGILAAVYHQRWPDHLIRVFGLLFYSMPHFFFALLLIFIFAVGLGWLPASQAHSVNADQLGTVEYVFDFLRHLILPSLALGIPASAATARYVRNHLLEQLRQDYIRTARAKGLPERHILFRHALPNAMIPLITLLGLSFPFLLSGAAIIEVVFAWPGMGRVTVDAIFARDYPLIIANTFVAGFMVILGNLTADLLYARVDPRIRMA